MMKRNGMIKLVCLGMLLVWLAACGSGGETAVLEPTAIASTHEETAAVPPTPTLVAPAAADEAAPTVAVATETAVPPTPVPPTPTFVPTVTPPPAPVDEAQIRQELQTLAFPAGIYEGVYAFPLPQDPHVWLVHSVGFRPYETVSNHAAALYRYVDGQWQELARVELVTPDILYEEAIAAVDLGDGRYWFEEYSYVGAHGSCYELLRYDFAALDVVISNCHSSNASGGIGDLNQDGRPDLVLNQTIDYVFCFACGVRYPYYDVLEFVDGEWQPVTVRLLPDDAQVDMRNFNNEAVRLYNLGLFKQAEETINLIVGDVPLVLWNQAIIRLHAEDARFQAQNGPLPVLGQIFYGDYAAALDMLRVYPPVELFTLQNNPLLVGTVAEGWEDTFAEWVTSTTVSVVEGQPDMASAHFLYGWGLYLLDATDSRVMGELETAVSLDPTEPLYQDSLAYLRGE
ncbi:MAG: hypothetical protein H6658_19985 [Ardenticatenaceae bacterium]|nr:hypothetical protein [Ardenticatenaceae bacterium]